VLRRRVREAKVAPATAFPGNGQSRLELAEIAVLKKEVAQLRAERHIQKSTTTYLARKAT
jgi:transposase